LVPEAVVSNLRAPEYLQNLSTIEKGGPLDSLAKSMSSSDALFNTFLEKCFNITPIAKPQSPLPLNVKFYSTLKYVAIPALDILESRSYNEVEEVLSWLSKCKGVKKIQELRVDDSFHRPHSEESIEAAILPFDVEVMKWRRADLSIASILKAAPNVRDLRLYSSGNWATIDHWIGPTGFQMLPKVGHKVSAIVSRSDFVKAREA
jgi:hypothetical protein